MLVADGTLDANALASKYVPELKDSAFGDATVRQLLDMTTGLHTARTMPTRTPSLEPRARRQRVAAPAGLHRAEQLLRVPGHGEEAGQHGEAFAYKTVNTDALGWVIARATGKSVGDNLQERIWRKLGAEQDAYFAIDTVGTEFAGGGLNTGLRDLARFGEMMRNDGRFNGQQIVPKAVVDDIRKAATRRTSPRPATRLLPGWSYRNMWWVSHNEHGAYSARGMHGQVVYIDPKAEMVIARYASFPLAANANLPPRCRPITLWPGT